MMRSHRRFSAANGSHVTASFSCAVREAGIPPAVRARFLDYEPEVK